MNFWWDKAHPNILRVHFTDDISDTNQSALIDNIIMQIMTEERGINLIITKEQEVLTSADLQQILTTFRLCLIQNNLKNFTIIHPEVITVPNTDKEIIDKWQFYHSLEEAYSRLGFGSVL